MDQFKYVNGELCCEEVPVSQLAEKYGTPLYVYSASAIRRNFESFKDAFSELSPLICFSVKSCSNLSILKLLGNLGAGLDVVSSGEIERGFFAGIDMQKMVYAGVGKSEADILAALTPPREHSLLPRSIYGIPLKDQATPGGIRRFNIESAAEFFKIEEVTRSLGVKTSASLRINPDVTSGSHAYTDTGVSDTKFGIDEVEAIEFFKQHSANEHVDLNGLHMHIGSPVRDPKYYTLAVFKMLSIINSLSAAGITIKSLNIGGGFAVDYETGTSPTFEDYAAAIVPLLREKVAAGLEIIMEPGRSIVADSAILLTRVLYTKPAGGRLEGSKFAICDAGMHTLIRPALYDSFHFVWPAKVPEGEEPIKMHRDTAAEGREKVNIVGPICECSDFIAMERYLPPIEQGDLLSVFTAGAYGASMASNYNTHSLPAEVLVDVKYHKIIASRQSIYDILHRELNFI
jgi:diaminopimelate decarboxylase